MVLYDWQRGKIPFFTLPPDHTEGAPLAAAGPANEHDAAEPDAGDDEEDAVEGDEAQESSGGEEEEEEEGDDDEHDVVGDAIGEGGSDGMEAPPSDTDDDGGTDDDGDDGGDGDKTSNKASRPLTALEEAAKELVSSRMAKALREQVAGRLPQRDGYFMPEDADPEGTVSDGEDEDEAAAAGGPPKKKRRRGGRGRTRAGRGA